MTTKRALGAYKTLLETARQRFKLATESDQSQRDRELEDIKFYNGDQWPDAIKEARKGSNGTSDGKPPVPPRPCMVLDKCRAPISQVLNQERQSDIGIEITPADDFGELIGPIDDTEIELREGLVRRIQRSSEAADARTWAFSRAVQCGRGYYGALPRYLPGKTSDQEVYVLRIYNQDSIRLDPAHEQPDGSDCEWQFMGAWVPWDTYKAKWPSKAGALNRISEASDSDFSEWARNEPNWVALTGEKKAVYVVDYYYIEITSQSLTTFEDGSCEWTEDVPKNDPRPVTDVRDVPERHAKWCKLDGINDEPLEETDLANEWLPIFKVLGLELHPHDEERRAEGMVRPMRSAGEGFNAMASKLVETVAYTPVAPIIMAVGQDEGLEAEWDLSTTRTIGRLHYNRKDANGDPADPPFSTPRDSQIAPIAASLQMFNEGVQSSTGVGDPALGQADPSVKSGRMQQALALRSEHGTSNFMDNLIRTVRHEARVINSYLYPIYGQRKGRLLRMMTGQNESRPVLVGQPFTLDPRTQRPVPVNGQPAPNAKTYQLTPDAQFNVAIKVTKNFDTRREQQNAILGEMISSNPELMTVFGDLFFESMDTPGSKQMAERAKVMLAPPVQALLASQKSGQPPLPPQVQQQMQQGQQMIQELTQKLKEYEQVIQGKQVEQQGKLAIVREQEQYNLEQHRQDNETKLAVAELGAKVDRLALFLEERARLGSQQHEHGLAASDAGHEEFMAQLGQQHALEAAQQGVAGQGVLAEQGQGHALAQGQQAADLAPAPAVAEG